LINLLALKKEVFDLDPYYLVLLVVPIIESTWGLLAILFLPLNLLLFAMHLNFLEVVQWAIKYQKIFITDLLNIFD